MALTPNFATLTIHSDASITDMVAFHAALRDIEDNPEAMVYPVIHTYKQIDLGGGAYFPAIAFINGWTLQFPPGSFEVKGGNLKATINPVAGCYVDRTQSAAYAVTSVGGSGGASAAEVAAAVRTELATELQRMSELAKIHGLVPGAPLVVSPTERSAGGIVQTVVESGGAVTVTRA